MCEQFMDLSGRSVDMKTYLVNLSMFQSVLGFEDVDGAHWYLFSILILSVWIWLIENTLKYKVLGYLVFLLFIEYSSYIYPKCNIVFQTQYASIAVFAIMLRYLVESKRALIKHNMLVGFVAIVSMLLIFYHYGLMYTILCIGFCSLFLLCYYQKLDFFQNPLLVYIGSISYYIYLIHQNVSYMILNTLSKLFGNYHLWYLVICVPIVWGLSITIKMLSDKIYALLNPVKNKILRE